MIETLAHRRYGAGQADVGDDEFGMLKDRVIVTNDDCRTFRVALMHQNCMVMIGNIIEIIDYYMVKNMNLKRGIDLRNMKQRDIWADEHPDASQLKSTFGDSSD